MFPGYINRSQQACSTYTRTAVRLAKGAYKRLQDSLQDSPIDQTRARFAAGRTTALPCFPRHCCQATRIGAATAMEEYVPMRMPDRKSTRLNSSHANISYA